MKNVDKAARMSAAAFQNAIRLHHDSALLYENERYPSALQLSVLSQEEVGKTFLLEEFVFRVRVGEGEPARSGWLLSNLASHKWKQFRFSREEYEASYRLLGSRGARFLTQARSGELERRKQDATYVGLTRDEKGKPHAHGRIVIPASRVREKHAAEQITRVGDLLTWLVEGYLHGMLVVDTTELEKCLTRELADELHRLWPRRSRALDQVLTRWGGSI